MAIGDYVKTFWAAEDERTMSESDCLNLNIVTLKDAVGKDRKLPVLVWIYGIFLVERDQALMGRRRIYFWE